MEYYKCPDCGKNWVYISRKNLERSVLLRCDACKMELTIQAIAEGVSEALAQIRAGLSRWVQAFESLAFWARLPAAES